MRKIIIAAGAGLIVSMSAFAAPDEQTPEANAYFSMSFGGAKNTPQKLHYGLRLDHDRFFVPSDKPLPPLMQLDFTRRGVGAISVNGLNVLKPAYRLNQNDDEFEDEEFEEEDEGFFESIGSWFGRLFGDDEEGDEYEDQAVAAGDADADEPAEDDEPSDGYDAVDWGLLAIGLIGVGYVTAELIDGEDDGEPRPTGVTEEGEACFLGQNDPECLPVCSPVDPTDGMLCFPEALQQSPLFTSTGGGRDYVRDAAERSAWLDSGTGQMGDLYARD